jgi:fructose-1-phosphate kinase PfkB-like protein
MSETRLNQQQAVLLSGGRTTPLETNYAWLQRMVKIRRQEQCQTASDLQMTHLRQLVRNEEEPGMPFATNGGVRTNKLP